MNTGTRLFASRIATDKLHLGLCVRVYKSSKRMHTIPPDEQHCIFAYKYDPFQPNVDWFAAAKWITTSEFESLLCELKLTEYTFTR